MEDREATAVTYAVPDLEEEIDQTILEAGKKL